MANSENTQTNKTNETEKVGGPAAGLTSLPESGSIGTRKGDGSGTATATARSFYDQAKETAGKAYEAVTDKTAQKLDERKSSVSGGLATVADSVRQVSDNLGSSKTDSGLAEAAAKYTSTAARKIEDVAGYFESRNVRDMARDLEGFARRNPAIFLGAAFGLGLLAARFLKSTPRGQVDSGRRELTGSADFDQTRKTSKPGISSKATSTEDQFAKPM